MSRSNHIELKNPAEYFFQWDAKAGFFQYYDREKKEEVNVPLPFSFMVLDTLSTVKGYSNQRQMSYYSNEVRDISKDTITLKNKAGVVARGTWEELQNDKSCDGIKYVQSVYVAIIKKDGSYAIANVQMKGASVSSWIDFRKHKKVMSGVITVASSLDRKNGTVSFKSPLFSQAEISDEAESIVRKLDVELQKYLTLYFGKHQDVKLEESLPVIDEEPPPTKEQISDGLPF